MTMKHFTRALCVVDTCSIINLDEITLGRKDVLRYVRCDFDVHVSDVIPGEFLRHKSKMCGSEGSYWERFLKNSSEDVTKLHNDADVLTVFHSTPPTFGGPSNAGEYGNARLAMELLMSCRAGQVIFVTDDEKACRAFLLKLRESFPGVALWTSLDVVFYVAGILMMRGQIGSEDVEAALRDLVASAGKWPSLSREVQSDLVRRRDEGRRRLRALEAVARVWRRNHV